MTNSQNLINSYNHKNFLIHHYHQVPSTNELAIQLLKDRQIFANEIILSNIQTQGKGRLNRQWLSPLGNLYFSLIVDITMINKSYHSSLPLMCSIAVNKIISDLGQNQFIVLNKWPNDLLIENKKVCGILVENLLNSHNQQLAIIGVGININSHPQHTRFIATNLSEYQITVSNVDLLNKFLDEFNYFFEIWKKFGFKNLKKIWLEKSYQLNQEISINTTQDPQQNYLTGIFDDIDELGNLILLKDQQIFTISVGDVS
jgi:BirA family biotin operon repressor/biotin-[acetyl-CoA-carboxylase] ligase